MFPVSNEGNSPLIAIAKIIFAELDWDNTGALVKQDIRRELKNILDDPMAEDEFEKVFQQMDENSDGLVSFDGFMRQLPAFPKASRLAELVFDSIDCNESDSITKQEICKAMAGFGVGEGDVDAWFAELDQNGDGIITYDQFRSAFEDLLDVLEDNAVMDEADEDAEQTSPQNLHALALDMLAADEIAALCREDVKRAEEDVRAQGAWK